MTVRTRENVIYSGIVLGCVLFLVWIIPVNSPPYPGYGLPTTLVPNLAVGFILFLAILELIKNFILWRKAETPSPPVPEKDKARLWHLTKYMVPCVLVLPAMKWLGFIPASVVFILMMQLFCGQRSPWKLVAVTIGIVGFMFFAMKLGGLPMP